MSWSKCNYHGIESGHAYNGSKQCEQTIAQISWEKFVDECKTCEVHTQTTDQYSGQHCDASQFFPLKRWWIISRCWIQAQHSQYRFGRFQWLHFFQMPNFYTTKCCTETKFPHQLKSIIDLHNVLYRLILIWTISRNSCNKLVIKQASH